MKYFLVEVYDDNDITPQAINIELLGIFGNMIAGVKEVQADELATLRTQLAEAREALEYLSQKDNYLTIQTGIIAGGGHASDFANFALRKINKVITA